MASNSLQVVDRQTQIARPSFEPQTFQEALEFSKVIADSDLVPKDFKGKPGNILVAIQMGKELGVPPMQAMQGIAVINGRPSVWGDLMWALVTTHPDFEDAKEELSDTAATVTLKRRGRSPVTVTFTKEDAIKASLWDKAGPWKQYPRRQLQWRARTFAARDLFPDALKGMTSAEETLDYEGRTIDADKFVADSKPTGKIDVKAEPPAQAQTEEVIGKEAATEFYKVYKAHGWTPEESKTFLKGTFGIEPPKTSADIPKSRLKEAMDWASMNAPIRDEANQLFEQLGWTTDEKQAFVNEQKWNWPSIVAALKAEVQKRNQQEQ